MSPRTRSLLVALAVAAALAGLAALLGFDFPAGWFDF